MLVGRQAVAYLSVLHKIFVNNMPKIIKKSHIRTKLSSRSNGNDISLKVICLEEINHFDIRFKVASCC